MTFFELATEAAKVAPIGTFLMAITASFIAVKSIQTQRDIARKRASLDMLAKLTADKVAYQLRVNAREAMDVFNKSGSYERFSQTDHYHVLLNYLESLEIICVGINTGVLDETVCFECVADMMIGSYDATKTFLGEEEDYTCAELRKVAVRWKAMTHPDAKRG